jgi:hypothetical protein
MAFDIKAWSDYGVAIVGAAAVLVGLLFVAVSVNSAWFSSSAAHRGPCRSGARALRRPAGDGHPDADPRTEHHGAWHRGRRVRPPRGPPVPHARQRGTQGRAASHRPHRPHISSSPDHRGAAWGHRRAWEDSGREDLEHLGRGGFVEDPPVEVERRRMPQPWGPTAIRARRSSSVTASRVVAGVSPRVGTAGHGKPIALSNRCAWIGIRRRSSVSSTSSASRVATRPSAMTSTAVTNVRNLMGPRLRLRAGERTGPTSSPSPSRVRIPPLTARSTSAYSVRTSRPPSDTYNLQTLGVFSLTVNDHHSQTQLYVPSRRVLVCG